MSNIPNEQLRKIILGIVVLFFVLSIFGTKLGSFIVIIIITLYIIKYLKKKNMAGIIDVKNQEILKKTKNIFLAVVVVILGLWLFFSSIIIVDAGETGVYSLFGKVNDNELHSGFHLVNPLGKVNKLSVRTEEYTMSVVANEGNKQGDDSIDALTKEGLKLNLDITVLYHLQEDKASDVYRDIGLTYDEKVIRPEIRSSIREVISQYTAKEIYSDKREESNKKIFDILKNNLEPRGIVLETVLLRNVALPENLAKSIQEKLQAEQEAQKYDFILDKEKKEKQRKVIEAEGQRDSQKIINESLSPNYLYYLYIQGLKDRQGTIYIPTSPTTGMPVFKDLSK